MRKLTVYFLGMMLGLLSGCATHHPTLYSWGRYNPQVYAYFKGEPVEKQIQVLEEDLAFSKSSGKKLPPGFYAHLGLLYEKVGRSNDSRAMLELEKQTYPESSVFIDNLFNKFK